MESSERETLVGGGQGADAPESNVVEASAWAATDVGQVRDHNEDSFLVDEDLSLFLVADGMGGHACGEVASYLASKTFRTVIEAGKDTVSAYRSGADSVQPGDLSTLMEKAMLSACREVFETAQRDPSKRGMGTTCSALLIARDRGFVAHVGDSRVFLVRDGHAVQITRDHSVLNELVESGSIDAEAAKSPEFAGYRNALARAVGVCAEVEVDTFQLEVLPGDAFVLGSDGLTHYVTADELPGVIAMEPDAAPPHMVGLANERGGHDNITAVMVKLDSGVASPPKVDRTVEFARKVKAFRRIPLFRHLDYAQLIRVLSATDVETFLEDDIVIQQGTEGDALYVVLSGKVRLEKDGVALTTAGPGSHFGELSLIDRSPRSATARVTEEARLLNLKRAHLHELVRKEPHIAVRLLWSVAEVFAARLRRTTEALTERNASLTADVQHDINPLEEPDTADPPEETALPATDEVEGSAEEALAAEAPDRGESGSGEDEGEAPAGRRPLLEEPPTQLADERAQEDFLATSAADDPDDLETMVDADA